MANRARSSAQRLQEGVAPSSYRAPVRHPGIVSRDDIVKRLMTASWDDIVVVTAAAGYGKTTTVMLWDAADTRDFAWVHLDSLDNDPVHLLQHIALAVNSVRPIAHLVQRTLTGSGRNPLFDMVPALLDALEDEGPFVLVFDDLHTVNSHDALECLTSMVAERPRGCQLVISSRMTPPLHLARRMAKDQLALFTEIDLAMGSRAAGATLASVGVELDDDDLASLVEHTEGWPAGLHLAGLAIAAHPTRPLRKDFPAHSDLIAQYFLEEVLDGLPDEVVDFLERSAILERMDAALLDELLERDDSGQRLHLLVESGNMFLVPLDDEGRCYRYHRLFADLLRQRLFDRHANLADSLNQRASLLWERRDDIAEAIRHAVAGDDVERAADLVFARTQALVAGGRIARLREWLTLIGRDAIESSPSAALAWAWYGDITGDIDVLKRGVISAGQFADTGPLPDGSPTVEVPLAVLRAMLGWEGVDGVIRDARIARAGGDHTANPWWVIATVLEGTALSMRGDLDEARERFLDALHVMHDAPAVEAPTLAHLALIACRTDDMLEAERLAARALDLANRHDLDQILPTLAIHPTVALVMALRGRSAIAEQSITRASLVSARLGYLSPRAKLNKEVLLGEAALALGDPAQAREFATEADRARREDASALFLNARLDDLHARLAARGSGQTDVTEPITQAELKVLRYLPTHLSLQQIAKELLLSRNTVKSHSAAIYRKLGVASRSEAVADAQRRGILSG